MGFTSPESIIQLSSCELSQPGHVAQEAAWFFGERRPLWLPPFVKSTTFVAPQVQGSTSTSLAGDEWCKNRLWRDGGGVSSSVSLFHKLCVLCWYFFGMRFAGVLTALVVYSLHIAEIQYRKKQQKTSRFGIFSIHFLGVCWTEVWFFQGLWVRQSWMVTIMLCSTGRTSGGVGSAIEQARKSQWDSAKILPWRSVTKRSVCFAHLCSIW